MTRIQDNGLATDVLIQLKGPLVSRKVTDFLGEVEKGQSGVPVDVQSTAYLRPLENVYRIVETCEYREALPVLAKLATAKTVKSVPITVNQTPLCYSNRTGALAVAFKLLNVDPADYKIHKLSGSNLWVISSEADENEAVRKFEELWDKHKSEYGGGAATRADTQPAGGRPGV